MKKRVLIVDNDDTIVTMIEMLLDNIGYEARGVLNGGTAIKMLETDANYDLIILDVMMPSVNGWQVMEFLKADKRLGSIPVMLMTAKADDESISKGLHDEHAADYIIKPFEMDDFIHRINKLVGQR
ncbi:MAG: response regulator [Gemmatimonadetes bacterium]|nr:MAG: response regulator [Gemmatimonadota bacterium]